MDIVSIAFKGILLPMVVLVIGVWLIKRVRADLVTPKRRDTPSSSAGAMEAMMTEARAQRERLKTEE